MSAPVTETAARPRRGRPSRSQANEINRLVLDAARDCFIERGYDATTMDDIAERAGVSKVTLYARHDSKASLLESVIEDRIAAWSEESNQRRWLIGDTLEQRLTHYGRSMLEWSRNDELASLSRLVRGQGLGADTIGRDLHAKLREPMISLLARELEAFAAAEGRTVAAPRTAATMFLGLLLGYQMVEGLAGSEAERETAYVERIVALFLHGRAAW